MATRTPKASTKEKLKPAIADATRRERGQLPRGRHGLTREEVTSSQRRRIVDAMAALCSERSYPAVRVTEIVARAGVSRATFYELFRDREDCFAATMEEALKRLMSGVMPTAYGEDGEWPERVAGVIEALLRYIARDPSYSQMAMLEALAGGQRTFELYRVGTEMFVALLDQGREHATSDVALPTSTARAVQGACEAMIVGEMIAGRIDRVPELLPDVLYMSLTPYLGQRRALTEMRAVLDAQAA